MDIDILLDAIFDEYRKKYIRDGENEAIIENKLKQVRDQVEDSIREATSNFYGMPINDRTRSELREAINNNIRQYLDTDIRIESIEDRESEMTINMTYRPLTFSNVVLEGNVIASSINPLDTIISNTL